MSFCSKSTGGVIILDANRKALYPANKIVTPEEVFYYYSKSKVKEFLAISTSTIVFIEMRNSTLTLTSGEFTLEMTLNCPPICPGGRVITYR